MRIQWKIVLIACLAFLGIMSSVIAIQYFVLSHEARVARLQKQIRQLGGNVSCDEQYHGGPPSPGFGGVHVTHCWISFAGEDLTDEELASLVPLLEIVRVEVLDLSGTRITDSSVDSIVAISPQIVHTANTQISSQGSVAIQGNTVR